MTLGLSDEHRALHDAARRWVGVHCDPSVARAALDAPTEQLPPFWDDLAKMGWLGLAVSEAHGGEGYGLAELAVVLEELGRAVAPGPFLPTVLAASVIDRYGSTDQRAAWLPGLVDGSTPGAVAFGASGLDTVAGASGGSRLAGRVRPALGGALASVLLLPDAADPARWYVVTSDEVEVSECKSLDATRRYAQVDVADLDVAADRVIDTGDGGVLERREPGGVDRLAAALVAAESVGGAAWCVETAARYAQDRRQFGRPIGQFQAVKHRCADMLATLEQARAAAWDASRGGTDDEALLTAAVAGALAPEAFFETSKDCIQVLGGIGFTWDHDAHLYFKRATAMRLLVGGAARWRGHVADLTARGVRRTLAIDLPPEADEHRVEVRQFLDELRTHDKLAWNTLIADAGYLVANWPEPWGRGAGAVEQLVIEAEFAAARIRRPHLAVGAWALPTIIAHGTVEQQERWVPSTLRGEVSWCQMFSEPGAGSDLAGLATRADRVDGGWLLNGQKVWTTLAHQADWGICLARTDPDAPKHDGISCFIVDMRTPGLDIRPLRELTGDEMFNEVFLDDVLVPDNCLVGELHHGWEAARTTLANERVSMGSGSSMGPGVEALLDLARRTGQADDPLVRDTLGSILADAQSLAIMGLRSTLRSLAGAEPGSESSVRKLLGVLHDQRVQEVGVSLLGPDGGVDEGEVALWLGGFLGNRSLSIAGGTSEIQRNVIAERLLGLPKDP
jgi:alkylation response protein AidB-like acyl-CoA dehydrogenase